MMNVVCSALHFAVLREKTGQSRKNRPAEKYRDSESEKKTIKFCLIYSVHRGDSQVKPDVLASHTWKRISSI